MSRREVIELLTQIRDLLRHLVAESQTTTSYLATERSTMATTAILTFTTASGTPNPPPTGDGSGIEVNFTSDNPAVTLGAATLSGNTATAPITGTEAFNLSASVANTSGVALVDNDGVTPFIQPTAIPVAAVAEQTTTAVLSVS